MLESGLFGHYLAVMLLALDSATGAVLFTHQFAALGAGDFAVELRSELVRLDFGFTLVQPGGFRGVNAPDAMLWSIRFSWLAWRSSIFGVVNESLRATGACAKVGPGKYCLERYSIYSSLPNSSQA